MHNLKVKMHKPSHLTNSENDSPHSFEKEDPEHQNHLAKVLMFHSKGYSQSEIAKKLNVNQSTVSRDLDEIRKKSGKMLDLYLREEIPNELQIYISGVTK